MTRPARRSAVFGARGPRTAGDRTTIGPSVPRLICLLCALVACGRAGTDGDRAATPVASTAAPWTRAEWLTAADAFVADVGRARWLRSLPPEARAQLERLVTTAAWREVDRTLFERDGEDMTRFYVAFKKLVSALQSKAAVDELVVLGLYGLDVQRAFITAGVDFVDSLPASETQVRRGGLEKMRLGAAIEVCSLLYLLVDAGEARRAATFTTLTAPERYAFLSREGLQLIIATLDEKLLPHVRPGLRASYQAIRDVVARAHAGRAPTAGATRTTYQGIGPAKLSLGQPHAVVSTTGGFSVELGVGAMAKRVEISDPDGSTRIQHWIELQDGEAKFEAVCFDGFTDAMLVAQLQGAYDADPRADARPGTWFTLETDGNEAHLRILTVGKRGCVASVQAPRGRLARARVDAFLMSLAPAP